MASERDQQSESRGRLLLFRRLRAGRPETGAEATKLDAERSARIRRARLELWVTRSWIVAAWLLAASRVHAAIAAREVFGVEASLAFTVAVAIPLARVRTVVSVVGEIVTALRRRRVRSAGPPDPKSHAA